jgi:hypothetical protein
MCTKHPLFLQQNVFNFVRISVAQHQVEFSCKLHHPQLSILMSRICASDQQVSRMLVGGMEVVGIFVFATETAFKNSTAIFWQVSMIAMTSLCRFTVKASDSVQTTNGNWEHQRFLFLGWLGFRV